MNEELFNVKLSQIPPHNTRYDRVYAPTSTLYLYHGLMAYCVQ